MKFTEKVGITLYHGSFTTINLTPMGEEEHEILDIFPFSSERKRMGIILKQKRTEEIRFLMKGADVIMGKIVKKSDWLEEECDNLMLEKVFELSSLVRNSSLMSNGNHFVIDYMKHKHPSKIAISLLPKRLHLLCLTDVEDKLHYQVKNTLETLWNGGLSFGWGRQGNKLDYSILTFKDIPSPFGMVEIHIKTRQCYCSSSSIEVSSQPSSKRCSVQSFT